ncbi:MAG: peptide deformylase [Candidatus Cryosericum sp.]
MQLVTPDNPILHQRCRAGFTVTLDQINQMFALVSKKNALGLAAPQVGIDARLFVTHWGEVFVNPRTIKTDKRVICNEGCLSLPGVYREVPRWRWILLADGHVYTDDQAIVIQHELDHLNGRLITDPPDRPDDIHQHIKRVMELVSTWPAWKQNSLLQSGQPTVKVPRSPVDNQGNQL